MANTFNNSSTQLSSTTTTDIYACPSSAGAVAVVLSCLVANVDGVNSADITISKTNSLNTVTSYLAWTVPVPGDAALEVIPNKLVLKEGEKLRAAASSANDLDITVSVLEIT